MSRPTKRIKVDNTLHLPYNSSTLKYLTRLSKGSLCTLALTWINELATGNNVPNEDSDQSDDEDSDQEDNNSSRTVYEQSRDDSNATKAKLVATIQRDWKNGLTYRQVAQLDVQYLKEKPNSRAWTAYQLQHTSVSPAYATPQQLTSRLRAALSPYHNHHLHLDSTPSLLIIRLQLIPPVSTTTLPAPLILLHLPTTPFLLLPPLPTSLSSILRQCLCTSLVRPPASEAKELQLKGKDWQGLREMLLGKMCSGGMKKWREGRGEGGGPLVPEARRVERDDLKGPDYVEGEAGKLVAKDDEHLKKAREAELGEVFGREDLPVLERLDYSISLPYPNAAPLEEDEEAPPPLLLRFEGTHVLQGLRTAVELGFADRGLPSWIGEGAKEGRNALEVGKTSS